MGVRNYRDLVAWQKAIDLADEVYELTERWPKEHRFGLTMHAQRAALSVPSNVAEGQGRSSRADFRRFVDIAHGSLCELETQLILASRRRFIDDPTLHRLLDQTSEVGRLLHGLMRSLRPADHN